ERQAEAGGVFAQPQVIVSLVPGNVQRHGGCRAGQLVDDAAIFQLLEDIARFAESRKAAEARAAGADAPGGNRNLETGHSLGDRIDVHAAARQLRAERGVVGRERGGLRLVSGRDVVRVARIGKGHFSPETQRVKAVAFPASTLRILPVDFAARSEAKNATASATSSG